MPTLANAPPDDLSSIMRAELEALRQEVEAMTDHGLSEEEAASLLNWAREVEGKIKAVAAVLANPGPEAVSAYLRMVAASVESTKSRRMASSSLRLLQAALARISKS